MSEQTEIKATTEAASPSQQPVVSVDDFHSDARDAERYRWMKNHIEWRRSGTLADDDSHSFAGCRFPYLANFSCAAMLDHNIDKMIENER